MVQFHKLFTFIAASLLLFLAGGFTNAAAAPAENRDNFFRNMEDVAFPAQQSGSEAGIRYEPIGYVTVPNLNLRAGPGTDYSRLAVVHQGQQLYLIGRNVSGNWLQIRQRSGQQGWVMTRYLVAAADDIASLPVRDTPSPSPIPVEAVGYVTINRLNVRSGPGLDQPIVGQVWRDERLTLLGRNSSSGWVQIKLSGYAKGWVSAQYIRSSVPVYRLPVTEVGIPEPPTVYRGLVTSYRLNIRTGPGFDYSIVGQLRQGQQVSIYGRNVSGDWFKIGLPDGRQAWVASRYVQVSVPVAQLKVL